MFGGLRDWRWIATRTGRCAKTFLSAVALDENVIFWLGGSTCPETKVQRRCTADTGSTLLVSDTRADAPKLGHGLKVSVAI